MEVSRVAEIPESIRIRDISRVHDGRELELKGRLFSSLSAKFDSRGFLTKRYGAPDVIHDEALVWMLKINGRLYAGIRHMDGQASLQIASDSADDEKKLVASHFLNMFTEESKSIWDRKPLFMPSFLKR